MTWNPDDRRAGGRLGQNDLLLSREPNLLRFWFSASLPCRRRGKHRGTPREGHIPAFPIRPAGFHGAEPLWSGTPGLTWQCGNILGTHLSPLRRKLQCGRSTGFGSQERGLSLSSAFYLGVHWSHLCTSEPFFFPCKMGIIVPMLCFEDVMK